jgi:hypothetical protein
MVILTDWELEKLSSAGLFYDISNIKYDFNFNSTSSFSSKKKGLSFDLRVSTSYEPVFGFLEYIYKNSPTAKISNSLIFTGGSENASVFLEKNIPVSKTCIILLHGFKSKNKQIYLQLAKRFTRNGIDGIVYTLPFHFERKYLDSEGKDVLGLEDIRGTLEFFRQTVIELRILIRVLKKIGYRSVGVLGFSFGGYCCSLISSFDKNVDFIVPMASIGDFGNLLSFRKGKAGLDLNNEIDRINDFFSSNYLKLICPIHYKPVIDIGKILFIQGLFDGRTPYREVLKLKKKWGNPKIIWYPCDHATFFLFNRLTLMLTVRFIKNIGL